MDIIPIAIFLFIIIYTAVRLAINPLLDKPKEINSDSGDYGLINLRNIGLVSESELEDIIKLYNDNGAKRENIDLYKKYVKVLDDLKEMGYYEEKEYAGKIEYLKNYLEIDDI